ncbi:MAG: HEPN domain-containing protein [Chloroflexi bacterium]|nr:HEPN domain-containing protein [Chloroflexota bacterium]MBU1749215.1 HEPN domain-containing protein [Chloroflexota bacterium]MBU1879996.1 HEPN domain-containing protein [Chloroflexota bacterium]
MVSEILDHQHEIELYMEHARQALYAAEVNLREGLLTTAVNRAYYAIFYAASALLLTQDIRRSKHASIVAAFRQYFVKPGLIEARYSDIYGDVMEARQVGDYEILGDTEEESARSAVADAHAFVARIESYLKQEGYR